MYIELFAQDKLHDVNVIRVMEKELEKEERYTLWTSRTALSNGSAQLFWLGIKEERAP